MRFVFFVVLVVGSFFGPLAVGNTDTREWSLADGTTFSAALTSYDVESGEVLMEFDDSTRDRSYPFDAFSTIDRAWLVEWSEFSMHLETLVEELGGELVYFRTQGQYPTDVYVYYPSAHANSSKRLPGMLLFNAGGKPGRYLMRHVEAAEAADLVIVALGSFRNNKGAVLEDGFTARFIEILPILKAEVILDTDRLFLGGNSGGAWRAFEYSYRFPGPWAGIYSNGGHLGYHDEAFYDNPPPYPAGMRIAMVNGNNDFNNKVIDGSSRALHSRDCKVAVFSFEGGHQVPPPDAQLKGFNWLLEQEDFDEE
ncbi:MAG: hypothetical protein ACPGKS_02850 [Coraliomargarita sp.]